MPSLDNMMLRQIIMDHYENPRNRELVEDDSYKKSIWIVKLVLIILIYKQK